MTISIFATLGADNQVIGRGGKTPFDFPEAYTQMQNICKGGTVIIGRKTFEQFRNARQLPRAAKMIVLSRTIPYNFSAMPEATVATSLQRAIDRAGRGGRTVIIGGSEVYEEAMPLADRLVLTSVRSQARGDTFFPSISEDVWRKSGAVFLSSGRGNPVPLEFTVYERRR